jgi:hypothetical protein
VITVYIKYTFNNPIYFINKVKTVGLSSIHKCVKYISEANKKM